MSSSVQVVASTGHGRVEEEVRGASGSEASDPTVAPGRVVGGGAADAVAAREPVAAQGARAVVGRSEARPVRRPAARSGRAPAGLPEDDAAARGQPER